MGWIENSKIRIKTLEQVSEAFGGKCRRYFYSGRINTLRLKWRDVISSYNRWSKAVLGEKISK